MSYVELAWIVDAVLAVVLHLYRYVILFDYIHINIHNTSLGCLLYVYFIFSHGLGRDFTWGDPILGD